MTQSRIPPAPSASTPDGVAAEAKILASRGKITPLYAVLLHSPPIAAGWEALLTAVRQQTELAPALRELIILRVAVLNKAPYEFDQHVPHARAAGVSEIKIEACRGADRDAFDPVEQVVLDYTDCITGDIQVPDSLFSKVAALFDSRELVEITTTVAAYNMVSRFLEAVHVR